MLKPLHALLRKNHQNSQPKAEQKVDFDLTKQAVQAEQKEDLPWFTPNLRVLPHYERLNQEIINYIKFAQLTVEEKLARDDLVSRISKQINLVIKAEVHAYGSYASDLASYYSDIDIGVESDQKIPLHVMMRINQLLTETIGKCQYIQAKVPIIRGTCMTTLIDFDISFNNVGDTLKDVQNALKVNPIERALILVIKAFLRQRGLNTPHTGGISGHILTQMVQAYQQNRLSIFPYPLKENLKFATSLMEFFELYGVLFNSKQVYILRNQSDKLEFRCRGDKIYYQVENQNQLVIITMTNNTVKDIAGGAYNFRTIRLSFEVNYFSLQQKSGQESILQKLISVDQFGRFTREKSILMSKSIDQSMDDSSSRSVVLDFEKIVTIDSDEEESEEKPAAKPKVSPGRSLFMSQYGKKSRFDLD
ncbi:DNA_polymerase sigma family protein [Hexamita inflata]|uniref:DNA_polymerase sigma family protein n=1 Tax=Hexamita inflata TaxID=28002 RepID=A0ABP1GRZ9_9EUKA